VYGVLLEAPSAAGWDTIMVPATDAAFCENGKITMLLGWEGTLRFYT